MDNYMKLELKAIGENESFARNAVAAFALILNPTVSELSDVKTAVSEAVTNCIVHGYKNGEGSALLENPALAEKIVKECVKSGKIITVKFRIGIDGEHLITKEFAKRMEGAGASLITIHGRTKDKIYAGEVNFEQIAEAKNAVKIPVVGMGCVYSAEDVIEMMLAGATAVEVGAANLVNPYICRDIVRDLPETMAKYRINNLNEIIGGAK